MPGWVTTILGWIMPILISFLESEIPTLETEGLAALQKAEPALYTVLLPLFQVLNLVPPPVNP